MSDSPTPIQHAPHEATLRLSLLMRWAALGSGMAVLALLIVASRLQPASAGFGTH